MTLTSVGGEPLSDATGTGETRAAAYRRLSELLRERTKVLHARAEHSGILRDLLRGHADRAGYALLLRNLLPAYRALELALEAQRHRAPLDRADWPALFRAPAIESDLTDLAGAEWERTLPLLPAGRRYAHRVASAAWHGAGHLMAHAYVRYLGDLSGGQIMRRLLQRSLGLSDSAMGFMTFPAITDAADATRRIRAAIDATCASDAAGRAMLAEAAVAFRLNIAVSEAVGLARRAGAAA